MNHLVDNHVLEQVLRFFLPVPYSGGCSARGGCNCPTWSMETSTCSSAIAIYDCRLYQKRMAHQSTRAPEAFTTGAHFAISLFTNAANCSGVFCEKRAPSTG